MTTTAERHSGGPGTYRVVGTRPIRHDCLEKVTGADKQSQMTMIESDVSPFYWAAFEAIGAP